ncbi:MAG: ATP-binding protein [Verrucomicrobiae bacterium]|nr:ATP-binding protein [Verrucomicrobiae bacterium]
MIPARRTTCPLRLAALLGILPAAFSSEPPRTRLADEFLPRPYTKEHGLPDNEVRSILQTRDGSLWVVTQRGVARFDGLRFVNFERIHAPEIEDEHLHHLAEDFDGHLWIGARDRLLLYSEYRFRAWRRSEGWRPGAVLCLEPSRKGGVWSGAQGILAHTNRDRSEWFGEEIGLDPGHAIFALNECPAGTLWIGTMAGLYRLDPGHARAEPADPVPRPPGHLLPTVALHRNRAGDLWALFTDLDPAKAYHGTNAWLGRLREGRWERHPASDTFPITQGPQVILEDSRGDVWLSATGDRIRRVRNGSVQPLDLDLPDGPDGVMCLHEDGEGNLWMGTGWSGLWRWQPRRVTTRTVLAGLPHDNTWTLCQTSDDAVWIGTDGGLARLDEGTVQTWTASDGLARAHIRALAVDPDGTLWIGTGSGLHSLRDGQLHDHPFPGEWFDGKIRALLASKDGSLWVATATALHRLQGAYRTTFNTADGLAHPDVRALHEEASGTLWIGTFGGGLQRLDQEGFRTYDTADGLSDPYVWALHEDADGTLWIGTASGLNRLRHDRLTAFSTRHGLPDNLVNFILEDHLGRLWISHDRGIYRVARAELNAVAEGRAHQVRCVSYTTADGLPSEETNGQKSYPAGLRARDGRLWFPTTRGVVIFDPALHHEESAPPASVIEQVRATGTLVHNTLPRDPFAPPPTMLPRHRDGLPRLPAGSGRVIEFQFTANTFVSADHARFRCRLVGLGEEWLDLGTRREAFFTNLDPGRYRFELIAANHHGVWQDIPAVFAFHLAPAFHQTAAFRTAGAAAIVLSVVAFLRWRTRAWRERQQLEQALALARERARIAQDLHDNLGANLTQLSLMANLSGGDPVEPHSLHERFRHLSHHAHQTIHALRDLLWLAHPRHDTVASLVHRLSQHVQNALTPAGIRCRIHVPPSLPDAPLPPDQRHHLFLAIKELVTNILKHARATEARFVVQSQPSVLRLELHDDGRGFDPAPASLPGPTGYGLENVRSRISQLGGRFHLTSTAGHGTCARIEVPVPVSSVR